MVVVRDSRQPASVLPRPVWCTAVGRRASCVAAASAAEEEEEELRYAISDIAAAATTSLSLQTSGKDTLEEVTSVACQGNGLSGVASDGCRGLEVRNSKQLQSQ